MQIAEKDKITQSKFKYILLINKLFIFLILIILIIELFYFYMGYKFLFLITAIIFITTLILELYIFRVDNNKKILNYPIKKYNKKYNKTNCHLKKSLIFITIPVSLFCFLLSFIPPSAFDREIKVYENGKLSTVIQQINYNELNSTYCQYNNVYIKIGETYKTGDLGISCINPLQDKVITTFNNKVVDSE